MARSLIHEKDIAAVARQQMLDMWGDAGFVDAALDYWSSLVTEPEPVVGTVADITGAPARTYRDWAVDHADDFRVLTTPEIADRYIAAFRTGRIDAALELMAPDVERVAPLESGGEPVAVRGVADIMANSRQLNADTRSSVSTSRAHSSAATSYRRRGPHHP